MDKFEREMRKEIKGFLQNKVELNQFKKRDVWEKIERKKKKSFSFNPWYWTVLASAFSLFLFLGFLFMTEDKESDQDFASPTAEEQVVDNAGGASMDREEEDEHLGVEPATTELQQWSQEDAKNPKSGMYQVEISEFGTVQEYISHAKAEWTNSPRANGSYEMQQDIEISVTHTAISYINFFEDQIEALGMTEEFDELQEIALSIHIERFPEEKFKIQAKKFEEKLFEIESRLK